MLNELVTSLKVRNVRFISLTQSFDNYFIFLTCQLICCYIPIVKVRQITKYNSNPY